MANEGNLPQWVGNDPMMMEYMRDEWGRIAHGEQVGFERLCLELVQSGLSWLTILKKREAFRGAFAMFDPDVVATFGEADVDRLMSDARIVRNHRKINAVITNAHATLALRDAGGLDAIVWAYASEQPVELDGNGMPPTQSPESVALARDLKLKGFTFVGPTNMYALMCAIGVVNVREALGLV